MSVPRNKVVDPLAIQILHVFNRCVRRAFLCGVDSVSGNDYSHRKEWIRNRLEFLTGIFAFDVATYAVMSNHFHLIVRSRPDIVAEWSDEEIAIRNMRLQGKTWFRPDGTLRPSATSEIERITSDPDEIQRLRKKLSDVSKLMLYFDRNLAVRANREDQICGAFWEGTFKAELIEDESSLLSCMAYVDLNPIRAMMAETLEDSEFTGAGDRIAQLRRDIAVGDFPIGDSNLEQNNVDGSEDIEVNVDIEIARFGSDELKRTPAICESSIHAWELNNHALIGWMAPIFLDERKRGCEHDPCGRRPSPRGFLPMSVLAYLQVVDWLGRQISHNKRGTIPEKAPPVLAQLGIKCQSLVDSIQAQGRNDHYFAATERDGIPEHLFG